MCVWFAYEIILLGFLMKRFSTKMFLYLGIYFLPLILPPNDQDLLEILNFCVLICEILDYYKIEKIKSRWSGMPGFAVLLRLNNYSKLF